MRKTLALIIVSLTLLTGCFSPTTLVHFALVGGGPVAGQRSEVRLEQNGQVVASATTKANGTFDVRLHPGVYTLVSPNFPGGCPSQKVTIQGSEMDLRILCNFAG
jgi:hypothetical protein